jgi:hypothetical protein
MGAARVGSHPHGLEENAVEPSELELYTTHELIAELMRRKTFLGVIVHSEQELKNKQWSGEKVFKMHYNTNLNASEAGRLLDLVAQHVERQDD